MSNKFKQRYREETSIQKRRGLWGAVRKKKIKRNQFEPIGWEKERGKQRPSVCGGGGMEVPLGIPKRARARRVKVKKTKEKETGKGGACNNQQVPSGKKRQPRDGAKPKPGNPGKGETGHVVSLSSRLCF